MDLDQFLQIVINILSNVLIAFLIISSIYWIHFPLKFFWYWLKGDEEKLWGTNWIKYKKEKEENEKSK